jgi:hypothetical protein
MKRLLAVPTLLACAAPAFAGSFDINSLQQLGQSEFRQLSEDLGAALSYKPLTPAEPLGITGFDVGVAVTGTSLKNTAVVQKAISNGTVYNTLPVPTLRAYKGLPLNLDVGLMVAKVPGSSATLVGGEVRWAFIPGDAVLPAVAVRGDGSRLSGINQLGFSTMGLDVSVSKGFLFATPYLGAGQVWVRSAPNGVPTLTAEKFTQSKVFGGVNLNFGLGNIAVEADTTGGIASYGVKFGFRF